MDFAKVINDEEGQLLRLPKGYRFDCDEVVIKRIGSRLISVYSKNDAKEIFRESLDGGFSEDCITAIEELKESQRKTT